MMSQENKAEAVKIGIGLSTQFIAAALGLLSLIGGIITFLLSQKEYSFEAVTFLVTGVIFLLVSIYFGFIGIARARNNGNRGWWIINVSQRHFDLQSLFGLLGLVSFAFSIFFLLATPKKADPILQSIQQNQELINTSIQLINSKYQCDSIQFEISRMKMELSNIKSQLSDLEKSSSNPSKKPIKAK